MYRFFQAHKRVLTLLQFILMVLTLCYMASDLISAESPATLPITETEFQQDTASFLNPGRGWMKIYQTDDLYWFDRLEKMQVNTILLNADLKNFRTKKISTAKLEEIRAAFQKARTYNLSVIFRAAYDYAGTEKCEPEDMNLISVHIHQLKDIFAENEDILVAVQAGFLGPWGEWHSSYYEGEDDEPSLKSQQLVVDELLKAVPESIPIQLRRPKYIRGIFDAKGQGSLLTETEAFSGTPLSRIGYHNDAVLGSDTDSGTYDDPDYDRQAELAWLNHHTKYTPVSAESYYGTTTAYSDVENTLYEFHQMHMQHINESDSQLIIQKWQKETYQGQPFTDYLSSHLGYRFVLQKAAMNGEAYQGGALYLKLQVENQGFGNLLQEKDCEVILKQGSTTLTADVNEDARKWYPENGMMTKEFYFSIPDHIKAGEWEVYFRLSSPFESLKENSAYSVRFASRDVWDESLGANLLGKINVGTGEESRVDSFSQISREEAERLSGGFEPPAAVKEMKISNDTENLHFTVTGSRLNQKSQIYLNTDENPDTGLACSWGATGFDYLVENDRLYRYDGTDGSWKWAYMHKVAVQKTDTKIEISIPVSALEIPSGAFEAVFMSNDQKELSYPLIHSSGGLCYTIK